MCYADFGLHLLLSVTLEASPLRLGARWRIAGGEFLVVSAVGRGAHCLTLPRVAVGLLCTAAVAAMKLTERQGATTRWHSLAKDDLDFEALGSAHRTKRLIQYEVKGVEHGTFQG